MRKLFTVLLLFIISFSLTFASGKYDHRAGVTNADTTKLKKDCTPDKRIKANKAATPAKTSSTGQHLKKDGTPDKRYKENKTKKN